MSRDVATMDELAIEGCPIKVRVEGEDTAPVLVLSHMLGTDLSLWDNLAPEFIKHFRVVRYDTRGHGGSGLGDAPVTLARLGRDVLAILDTLGIERAHFCGLSMGGAVGQWLLVHAPARIERAVIAGSAAKLGQPAVWNARIAAALADGMEQAVEPTLERWFGPAFAERAPEPVAAVRALVRATSPEGYAACCAALRDMDLRESLRSVTHPVLVVRGADDPSVSAEAAGHLVEAMANATAIEVEARHCASIEAEAEFSAAVVKFLTAKTAPRRATARPVAKPAKARDKPSARRIGQRGIVAARRPVAQTAPVSGKAVAKASATRKTAARAAPRPPAPSRRAAAIKATRAATRKKDVSPESVPAKSAKTMPGKASRASQVKAPDRAKATRGEKPMSGKAATSAPARRTAATARTPAARAKPPTAAALRAAAKTRIIKAGTNKTKSAGPAAGRAGKTSSVAPVKAAAGRNEKAVKASAKRAAAKPLPVQRAPAKPASAKPAAKLFKPASTKPAPAKRTPAKRTPAKPAPAKLAATKPATSRRAAAPVAKPRRSTGRGPAGSGRRKP